MIWEFPRCFEHILKAFPRVKQGALKRCTGIRVNHVGDIVGVEPLNCITNRYRKFGWVVSHILHANSVEMDGMGRGGIFRRILSSACADQKSRGDQNDQHLNPQPSIQPIHHHPP